MNWRALYLLVFVSHTLLAQTYSFDDRQGHNVVQQRLRWQAQSSELLEQLSRRGTLHCARSDYDCIAVAISDSRQMYHSVAFAVDEWQRLFHQTDRIIGIFQQMALPKEAIHSRIQYQTYYFLLSEVAVTHPDLLAFVIGKLGYYAQYETHYQAQQWLAKDAQTKKIELDKLKQLLLTQIDIEQRYLQSL